MTFARFTPSRRYDDVCAFCGDGAPAVRRFGKPACGKCLAAFGEAPHVAPTPTLRNLVKADMGKGPRDYVRPLHERALANRKAG